MTKLIIFLTLYISLPTMADKVKLNTQAELMLYFDRLSEQDFNISSGYQNFLKIKSELKSRKLISVNQGNAVNMGISFANWASFYWFLVGYVHFVTSIFEKNPEKVISAFINLSKPIMLFAGVFLYQDLWDSHRLEAGTVSKYIDRFNFNCIPKVYIEEPLTIPRIFGWRNYFIELPDEKEKATQKIN